MTDPAREAAEKIYRDHFLGSGHQVKDRIADIIRAAFAEHQSADSRRLDALEKHVGCLDVVINEHGERMFGFYRLTKSQTLHPTLRGALDEVLGEEPDDGN